MKISFDYENISVEVFTVSFFQSEDSSWNTALFSEFDDASAYMLEVCKRGFSPELKHCYLEKIIFNSDVLS